MSKHKNIEKTYVEPSTETERILANVWENVLNIEKVGIDDNFFNLGGDSILSIQIMSYAKKQGIDLTIQQIFKYPTIRELSKQVNISEVILQPKLKTSVFSLLSDEDREKLSNISSGSIK